MSGNWPSSIDLRKIIARGYERESAQYLMNRFEMPSGPVDLLISTIFIALLMSVSFMKMDDMPGGKISSGPAFGIGPLYPISCGVKLQVGLKPLEIKTEFRHSAFASCKFMSDFYV